MQNINPDLKWYSEVSKSKNIAQRCPYANAHKCNRYYSSIYLLGQLNITTKISDKKVEELDKYWNESGLIPLIEEHEPAITYEEQSLKSVVNFCPEVSFEFYGLFAKYMYKYVDDIDRDIVRQRLEHENKTDNWKWDWMSIKPTHYSDCQDYQHLPYEKNHQGNTDEILEMKPGFMGFTINLKALYRRAKKHLTSKSR